VPFRVEAARVDEKENGGAVDTAVWNAVLKAEEVSSRFRESAILAADTVVSLKGCILGKPTDLEDAFRMLRMLAGQTHVVVTGVCIVSANGEKNSFSVQSEVVFHSLVEKDILDYLRDVEVVDKAVSYALQEEGARIVSRRF